MQHLRNGIRRQHAGLRASMFGDAAQGTDASQDEQAQASPLPLTSDEAWVARHRKLVQVARLQSHVAGADML